MQIKGFGHIGINRKGVIKEIPFTNTIDGTFAAAVRTKFKNGDKGSRINSSDFKILLNGGSEYDGGITLVKDGSETEGDGVGTLSHSIVSGFHLEYRWNANESPVYMPGASDTTIATISSISLRSVWGSGASDDEDMTIGTATNLTGGSQYDYNDYISYVSYTVKIEITGDGTLASEKAAQSVSDGSVDIKPDRLIIKDVDDAQIKVLAGLGNYSNGTLTYENIENLGQKEPAKYELWVGTSHIFDSGVLNLSNPSSEEHNWLEHDKINFSYTTTAFN